MTRSNKKPKSKKQQHNRDSIKSIEYKKDDIVSYTDSDGVKSQVKIIGIHYDTPPDTYYTIEFEDGRHKQTIKERLSN
jgi:hypothetical protein